MNEFQAAYQLSQIEYQSSGQAKEAAALVVEGKFPVCYDQEIFCKFTDAFLAYEVVIYETFDTEVEALAFIEAQEGPHDEPRLYISRAPVVSLAPVVETNAPF